MGVIGSSSSARHEASGACRLHLLGIIRATDGRPSPNGWARKVPPWWPGESLGECPGTRQAR